MRGGPGRRRSRRRPRRPPGHRQDLVGEVEESADGEDEDRAGQQGGVGAVAGEVLADRDLEAAEAGQGDADADRGRVAADDADRQRDDAGEDRPARPAATCPRAPAGARQARRLDAASRRGRWASLRRSTAASRPANGHPEETLTRHQPISIPIGPRRGRECQCAAAGLADVGAGDPHPLEVLPARRASARSSSRLSVSTRARSRSASRASATRSASSSRSRSSSPRSRTRGSAATARDAVRRPRRGRRPRRRGRPARARGGRSGAAARAAPGARRPRRRSP